jgi:hypothetical protein
MATSQNPVNLLQQWSGASASVVNAIKGASAKTGVSFDYLMNKAKQESSFDPTAKANTSSATGLFQFIDSTWLQAVRDYGGKFGLGNLSDKISTDSNGKVDVSDAAAKQQILDLRKDPVTAANMTAAMTQDNASALQSTIGGKVGVGDLYLAHFLGLGGAEKFLKARQTDPTQSAADLFPSAAVANKNVFYNSNGSAKSLDDVYNFFTQKMDPAGSGTAIALGAAGNNVKTAHLPSIIQTAPSNNAYITSQVGSNQADPTKSVVDFAQRQLLETLMAGINNFGGGDITDARRTDGQLMSPYTSFVLSKLQAPRDASATNQNAAKSTRSGQYKSDFI